MSWLAILGAVMLVVAIASLLGAQPAGGRPAAQTNLMSAARVVLILTAVVLILVARL